MDYIPAVNGAHKAWRASDRCKIHYATLAVKLYAPVPLACTADIGDEYQHEPFDWLRRRFVWHLENKLHRRVGVLLVRHIAWKPHFHMALAALDISEQPLI